MRAEIAGTGTKNVGEWEELGRPLPQVSHFDGAYLSSPRKCTCPLLQLSPPQLSRRAAAVEWLPTHMACW